LAIVVSAFGSGIFSRLDLSRGILFLSYRCRSVPEASGEQNKCE